MKSLILVCLAFLVADSLGLPGGKAAPKVVVKSPSKFVLDLDRLPINTAVAEGTEVILQCAVQGPSSSHQVLWYEYITNPLGAPISSNEFLGDHPNRLRYTILHDDPLEYSLRIFPTLVSDGGVYQCVDASASPIDKRQHSVFLTVLAYEPNCTTTIRESGIVLEDSYQTNDCQLEYQGPIIPNMTWIGPAASSQRYIATATHIWAGVQFNTTRSMDGQAFQCVIDFTDSFHPVPDNTAENVPDYTRTIQLPQMFVRWGAKNLVIVPVKTRYDIGDVLTCSADGYPAPTFFWQNLRTNQVVAGHEVVVLDEWQGTNQTLRCDARNTIEDVTYSNIALQIVDVNPATTTTETTPATTTTAPPAVSDCRDLTGGWESVSPAAGSLCIRLDVANNGALRGLLRNDSDTFWVDIVGRAQATKFDQVGFNGIWPVEIGVSSFIGECHRCFGVEQLLVNVVTRSKSAQCGEGGPIRYTTQYTFYRSSTVQCPNLPNLS